MKKGDIVKLKNLNDDLYVVVKGPYESSFAVSTYLTETRLVVDVYDSDGVWEKVPIFELEVVSRS